MHPVRRAVITGLGLVSPLGIGIEATLQALGRGECAAHEISVFDASGFPQPCGGEVRAFNACDVFPAPKAIKLTDRAARFAVAAAKEALMDSGWTDGSTSRDDLGVVLGSSGSDLGFPQLGHALRGLAPTQIEDIPVFADRVLNGVNPLWLLVNLPNMASAHVAIQLGAKGPNSTIMSDWGAGLQAIGEAYEWIRAGDVDAVLAGAADSGLMPMAYAAFEQAGLFSTAPPYVPGEGAAVLLLEEEAAARSRGAAIRGEVVGYASTVTLTAHGGLRTDALASTWRNAVDEAGWCADDVATVAIATPPTGHPNEVLRRTFANAFGTDAPWLRWLTFEPWLGHAGAAAATIDLALAIASPTSPDRRGLLCSAVSLSGHAVTVAARPVNARSDVH